MTKIGLLDVKKALQDERFRKMLPDTLQGEVNKFLGNVGCPCNVPFYRRILNEYQDILQKYYPTKEIQDESTETALLSKNNFSVVNCTIHDLETHLKKLSPGRKQIAIARYEDQITLIVNDLDILY